MYTNIEYIYMHIIYAYILYIYSIYTGIITGEGQRHGSQTQKIVNDNNQLPDLSNKVQMEYGCL